MNETKQLIDNVKPKQSPANWDGLGNTPRNENLAKIRLGSFEKKDNTSKKDNEQTDKEVN